MKRNKAFLAFDLGASSGRILLGKLNQNRLQLQEISRFSNRMLRKGEHWFWDIFRLFEKLKQGLVKCVQDLGEIPDSIAVDTWGVDFGLLDRNGALLDLPLSYRDPFTQGAMEDFFTRIPKADVYQMTGIQFLSFNSLFQLFALFKEGSSRLKKADRLLFMPDLLNFMFTGIPRSEFTIATTSQLYDPSKQEWVDLFLELMNISPAIMPEVAAPGTILGALNQDISSLLGVKNLPVVTVASHDTASAVAAVPAEGENWAYISSGTWSLMGVESKNSVITPKAMDMNFTNEGGLGNTCRLLKNISGLWLLEECRRVWGKSSGNSYKELLDTAALARPFQSLIDPDHNSFLNPENMPEAIQSFCRDTGQPEPESEAAMVRCVLESLALKYRTTLDQLRELSPHPIEKIHIIGGGSKNRLLCQYTADASGLPVLSGPAEATAIGNIMVQALAAGIVTSIPEIRGIIARSFDLEAFQPQENRSWDKALKRFQDLISG